MILYVIIAFTAILIGMAISVYAFGTGGKRKKIFQDIYFSIEDVDGIGVLYTKTGEYSAIIKIENPVQKYSANIDSYYEFTHLLTAIAQTLGEGYAIHKQDVFVRKQFKDETSDNHEFLSESYFRYFTGRTYTCTTMRSMAAVCSLAGSAALVVLFLCSYLLSGVVTRPVGAAWAQQEQFLSDASHELKTPLTVILSSAELLNQSALPEQAAYIDNIRAEGRRMKLLVEDMLTLSRAQRSAGALPEQTVELSETAVTAALRFEPVAFEAGKRLEYDIAPSLPVRGDGTKLGQALAALLDNAVKYAADGTNIRLTAERQGRFAVVTVENRGADIPADNLPHIFDRFYRADEARTDGDSFGLGLPIAKAIIEAHRGTLRCESGSGVTRFIITLPLTAGKQERGADHA